MVGLSVKQLKTEKVFENFRRLFQSIYYEEKGYKVLSFGIIQKNIINLWNHLIFKIMLKEKLSITALKGLLHVCYGNKKTAKSWLVCDKKWLFKEVDTFMTDYLFTYKKEVGILYTELKNI